MFVCRQDSNIYRLIWIYILNYLIILFNFIYFALWSDGLQCSSYHCVYCTINNVQCTLSRPTYLTFQPTLLTYLHYNLLSWPTYLAIFFSWPIYLTTYFSWPAYHLGILNMNHHIILVSPSSLLFLLLNI